MKAENATEWSSRMHPLLIPFLSYSFLTIFTPGPANVSASALGSRIGYRRSLPYLVGMAVGFFLILTASGLLTDLIRENYAPLSVYLKWIGAGYIVSLAISLFLPSHKARTGKSRDIGFMSGFLLVLVNPKGIMFAATTFASFADLITASMLRSVGSVLFLALLGFCATSTWALTGAALAKLFNNKTFAISFNVVMALLLLCSAYSIIMH
jgi:cysteine/O-acetylserine efflux protein